MSHYDRGSSLQGQLMMLETWETQVQTYLKQKDYENLIHSAQECLTQQPSEPTAYAYLIIAYLAQEDVDAAQEVWLQSLINLGENHTQTIIKILNQIATEYHDDSSLATWLRQWIWEVAPQDTENLLIFAELCAINHNFSRLQELELPQQISQLEPKDFNPKTLRNTLHVIFKEIEGETLEPWHKELLTLGMKYVEKFPNLVFLSAMIQHHEKWNTLLSRSLLEWCIEQEPNNCDYHYFLVGIYYHLKDYHTGLELAWQLYEMTQTHGTFLHQLDAIDKILQGLLSIRGKNVREAEEIGQRYIDTLEQVIQKDISTIDEMLKHTVRAPFNVPFLLPYLRDDLVNNQRLKQTFIRQITTCVQKTNGIFTHSFRQREKLRIGFLSHTFRQHSVGWLMRWYLRYTNRQKLDFYMYALVNMPDAFAKEYLLPECKACVYYRDPKAMAEQIYRDEIDILIDLDSVTLNVIGVVLAQKPAPIMVSWLGWDAIGSPTMDYFVVDPYVLPDDAQAHYPEILWRLPHVYIAVDGFEIGVPTLRREHLGIASDATIFYSAQMSHKRHYETVCLQLEILKAVPDSYLLLKGMGDQQGIQEFFSDLAQDMGVNPDRLKFLERDRNEYLHRANMGIADVILDTYPYNGATTTLEALWAGVPLVTRVGQQYAARNSYSFLVNCGITEGIAWSGEEYVAWGIRLGTDVKLRQEIRQKLYLSRRTSPLWNGRQFAQEFDQMLWQMWQNYVQAAPEI
jgi:predicted O-linked N-acetylglucosamine transferase (SPINDLY family)